MKIVIEAEAKEMAELLLAIEERPMEKTISIPVDDNGNFNSPEDIRKYIRRFGQKTHSVLPD